jgi:TldD protein
MSYPTQAPTQAHDAKRAFGIEALDIEAILRIALQNGGALAELFFEETASTRVIYEGGRIDKIVDGIDRGVGLRILFDHRSVYGYSTDLTQASLERLAETLSAAVQSGSAAGGKTSWKPVEWRAARQSSEEISRYRVKQSPRDAKMETKIAICERLDRGAREVFPTARQVTSVSIDSLRKILVLNSDGLISSDTKIYFQMVCQVVGEKAGRVETAYETDGGFVGLEFMEETSPESIGAEAARRVKVLLDAKPAPAGTMAVVLAAEAGGTMIHEAVGHGLEADLACNGLSVYQNKVGQAVASPLITVVDDGTIPMKELHPKKMS